METKPPLETQTKSQQETSRILGIVINFFLPGVGTLIVGKVAEGILQIVIDIIAVFLMITIIFSPVAAGMLTVVCIWGLVSAATP